MTEKTDRNLLSRVSKHLSEHIGLYYPEKRLNELGEKLSQAMYDFGYERLDDFINWLVSSPLSKSHIEILASHLTVNETYFFREKGTFDVLEQSILPGLIKAGNDNGKRLRVWSAGCSTGEEPYSIAMLLDKMIPGIEQWNISILATDIDPGALQQARQGVYSTWSFRDTPQWANERYFKRLKGGSFSISPDIRNLVTFDYHNLLEENPDHSRANGFDIIFCRNVLMYFAPETVGSVARRMHKALRDGGFLIVGVVEASNLFSTEFKLIRVNDVSIYKKEDAPAPITNNTSAKNTLPGGMHLSKPAGDISVRRKAPRSKTIKKMDKKTQYEKAMALYEQGLYRKAESILYESAFLESGDPEPVILLIRVLANQGKLDDACVWCQRAIKMDKLKPLNHYLLATILQEKGKVDEAIIALNKAIYLDPDLVLAHFALGNLAKQKGRHGQAKRHFGNAADILSHRRPDEMISGSDGMTAGTLSEMINRHTK